MGIFAFLKEARRWRVFCVTVCYVVGAPVAADDKSERFDKGPLLYEPGQYFDLSADTLNSPANSIDRQRGKAFVQRLAGGRDEQQKYTDAQSLDELARGYLVSVDGWLSSLAQRSLARALMRKESGRMIAESLLSAASQMPDGSRYQLARGQTTTMHHGGMVITGEALLERNEPKWLAGRYEATTKGRCPFADGTIDVVQDRFLVEGRRDDALLFWGAIGEGQAWFEASEPKFLKLSLNRRKEIGLVEFPDEVSELFSAELEDGTLQLNGEFRKDCTIRMERRSVEPGPRDSRLARKPDEPAPEVLNSTAGVELVLEETGRAPNARGKNEVTYKFVASGFPRGKSYSMWRYFPHREPVRFIERMVVDEQGVMIVEYVSDNFGDDWQPNPLDEAIPLAVENLINGDCFEFEIVSDDESVRASARACPVPLEARQGSCSLRLQPWLPGATVFGAFADGFLPGEEIRIESISGKTSLESIGLADSDGRYFAYAFPEVAGEQKGDAEYRLSSESCSVALRYKWGVH